MKQNMKTDFFWQKGSDPVSDPDPVMIIPRIRISPDLSHLNVNDINLLQLEEQNLPGKSFLSGFFWTPFSSVSLFRLLDW